MSRNRCGPIFAGFPYFGKLERVALEHGYPDVLVIDNGRELRGRALDGWAHDHGVQLYFIAPGIPIF